MSKQAKHILVIRLSAMGDVAMCVPVLRAFILQYPQVKVTVLTRSFFEPFFRDLINVSVFHADVKGKHKGVLGLYRLSKELKKLDVDLIADLHNVLRSNILKFFFRSKSCIQISKGRQEKKDLISGKSFKQLKSTHERYAEVFEKFGFSLDLLNPIFPEKVVLSSKIDSLISINNRKLIGIAPFAAHEGKMYPLDLMKEVIEKLSEKYQIILFGGGKREVNILNEVEAEHDNVTNIAGKLTLDEELDVISNLDLMLSMDSGNAHLGAMMGIKVVTIWGVTHPYAGFSPFNQPEDYALLPNREAFPKIPTSIYGNTYPEGYGNASRSISVNQIITKVDELM